MFSQNGYTWDDARGTANNATFLGMPGYLATVTSQAENDFLYAHGEVSGGRDRHAVRSGESRACRSGRHRLRVVDALTSLGGADAATEGTWRWINGPETGTVFWTGGASWVHAGRSVRLLEFRATGQLHKFRECRANPLCRRTLERLG